MTTQLRDYRLDGIYRQRQEGFFMQRVKLAAGVISAQQARKAAQVATIYGKGALHLTIRGSIEIHWLTEEALPLAKQALATVGLTSRGACGGAVRGISCSDQGAAGFPLLESLARRIHRHFTGNPHFEQLPKKFKVGIEADTNSRRHLVQDFGLVFSGVIAEVPHYDIYLAGGLGREPQAGFLYKTAVPEQRIIPIIESVARVYRTHTAAGKRLKHLVRSIGESTLCDLIDREAGYSASLPVASGLPDNLSAPANGRRLEIDIPAGHLPAGQLELLADLAEQLADGILMISGNQNIALHPGPATDLKDAEAALAQHGFSLASQSFKACPGTELCRMGLSPTRQLVGNLLETMGDNAKKLSFALSGCPNSCTQPQLAEIGIISSGLVKDEQGERSPRFDICRLGPEGLGTVTDKGLTTDELTRYVKNLG